MAVAEVEQFSAVWAEKSAAKSAVMEAVGVAKLAEKEGRDTDAAAAWSVVEAEGFSHGTEGAKQAEAQALADALYTEHPEYFAAFEGKTVEQLCFLADAYRAGNLEDDLALLTMYELAKFERQNIGGKVEARIRLPHPGGK